MSFPRRASFELSYLLGRSPWDRGLSPPELLEFIVDHPPGRGIDLGCGTGTNVITLARRGWQVTGIDFSHLAILRARRKARRAGIQAALLQGDVSNLSHLTGPFDLALDIGCYHSLSSAQQQRYAEGLARLIRPGGTFLLYGFERGDPASPETWLTAEALGQRFGSAFDLVRYQTGTDRQRPSAWATLVRRT
ncbi:MAG: class I SAM-dependent methyltransferase [Chloroflexota bacterium]